MSALMQRNKNQKNQQNDIGKKNIQSSSGEATKLWTYKLATTPEKAPGTRHDKHTGTIISSILRCDFNKLFLTTLQEANETVWRLAI